MTRAATEVVFGRAKSIRATVMQLTTCTLGAGILTLPFALSCFGLGLGLIVLVCNSAFALVCSYFLSMACALQPLCAARSDVRRARRPVPNHHILSTPLTRRALPPSLPHPGSLSGEYSYGGLARAAGGETMALVVDILILMVLLMVMAGGIDALGDSLGQVVVEIFGGGCTMTAVAANGTSAFLLSSSGNGTGGNGNGGAPEWSGGWCAWAHGAKLIAAHTAKVTGAVSVAPTLSGRLAVTAIATFGFLVPLSLVPVAALRFSSLFSVISLVLIVFFIVSRGIASVSHPPAATSGDPEDDPWTFANLFKLGAWRDWLHGISLVAFAFANQIQIPMFQLDLEPVPVFFSSTPRGDVASPSASPDGHRNGGTKRPSDGPGGLQAKIDAADQEDRQMPLLAANRHVIDVVDDFADVRTPPSSFNHERPSASSFSSSRGGDLNSAVASAEEREELRGKLAARQGSGDKMKLVILFTSLTLSCLFCTIAAFGLISAEGGKVADDILQQVCVCVCVCNECRQAAAAGVAHCMPPTNQPSPRGCLSSLTPTFFSSFRSPPLCSTKRAGRRQ